VFLISSYYGPIVFHIIASQICELIRSVAAPGGQLGLIVSTPYRRRLIGRRNKLISLSYFVVATKTVNHYGVPCGWMR